VGEVIHLPLETLAFVAQTPPLFGGVCGFMVSVMRAALILSAVCTFAARKAANRKKRGLRYTHQNIWRPHGSLAQIVTRSRHPANLGVS